MIGATSHRGVFITGTDTSVGKTVAAAAVLLSLREKGIDAIPMKPVQTGAVRDDGGRLMSPDLDFCLRMAGIEPNPCELADMAPYLFEPACSPHLAAAMSGREIALEHIAGRFHQLIESHEAVVVEGAGGLMVPIVGDKMMLDLMMLLRLPVILVARPGLGTLNHTLLSLGQMERSGLEVLGVLFCAACEGGWGAIEEDNRRAIERIGRVRILGSIPYMEQLAGSDPSPDIFRQAAMTHLDLPWRSTARKAEQS